MTTAVVNIKFTHAACVHIKQILTKEGGIGFRLSVKKTGCSGYSYFPVIITEINPTDITFDIEEGVRVYVDSAWLSYFAALSIDYVEDEKAGLKQKRLTFVNPNEAGRCGCGESFYIE